MLAQEIPISDERAVETGQLSQFAQPRPPQTDTVGYFEPHQMVKLAQNGRLYVIADGVGGAAAGQVASQYAVKKTLRNFYTQDNPDLKTRLLEVIQQANHDIYERNKQFSERRPMAAAITACLIHNNKLLAANVGDNRVYVVWDKDIELLNSDLLAKEKADEAKPSVLLIPEKSTLPKEKPPQPLDPDPLWPGPPTVLGLEKEIKVETFSRRLFAGDTVVLCSGSLTGYVTEQEIAEAITLHAPIQAIQRLLALAAERGNRGHIAISVTRVLSSPVAARSPMPMVMPTEPKWSDWETPAKPATRPLSKPIPATFPSAKLSARPKAKPFKSIGIPLKETRWHRRGLLLIAAALVILCVLPTLAWRYLIPPDLLASVPLLGAVDAALRERVGASDTDSAETSNSPGQNEAASVTVSTTTAQSSSAAPVTPVTGPNSPLPTPAATLPKATSTPESVVLPTATPSPTPAPTIVLPVNCENKARFITDVTVEDGAQFAPTNKFEKVWRIRNEGTCPWGPGYSVRFLNGDYFGAAREIPVVERTEPDETGDFSVPMIAPRVEGEYRGVWQLYDQKGDPFGPTMYLEIEVVPGAPAAADTADSETVYDFIENAPDAAWSSGQVSYTLQETRVSEALKLPESGGLVALGSAQLRGNVESPGNVLLTYPHQQLGFIEGNYLVDTPLQPGDAIAATLGFPKLSILSDDGVTFEVSFTPADDSGQVLTIFSKNVQYRDSPLAEVLPLTGIQPGQTGTFTLRVLSGQSTSRDWAVWIDMRLIRP